MAISKIKFLAPIMFLWSIGASAQVSEPPRVGLWSAPMVPGYERCLSIRSNYYYCREEERADERAEQRASRRQICYRMAQEFYRNRCDRVFAEQAQVDRDHADAPLLLKPEEVKRRWFE